MELVECESLNSLYLKLIMSKDPLHTSTQQQTVTMKKVMQSVFRPGLLDGKTSIVTGGGSGKMVLLLCCPHGLQ